MGVGWTRPIKIIRVKFLIFSIIAKRVHSNQYRAYEHDRWIFGAVQEFYL